MAVEMRTLAVLGAPPQPRIPVRFQPVDASQLAVARRGDIFALKLDVSRLDEQKARRALEELSRGMAERFGIRTIFARATENEIHLVIMGSPFAWSALLLWLPTILGLLGIVLFAVSVWQAVVSIPSWVWALLIISGGLILFGPAIGEWILSQVERARRG
jgi:hypothetical protein